LPCLETLKTKPEKFVGSVGKAELEKETGKWPVSGYVEFVNVHIRYREETDLVLKGLSFKVNPGEKVGIIGRTGAGKSTFMLAMSRILEVCKGSIKFDG